MRDEQRDFLRKTILELLKDKQARYTELEKKVSATCKPWATSNTFKSQLRYLVNSGCIKRISRGIYSITFKGENYLVFLTR